MCFIGCSAGTGGGAEEIVGVPEGLGVISPSWLYNGFPAGGVSYGNMFLSPLCVGPGSR